jgi:hypothetical protein
MDENGFGKLSELDPGNPVSRGNTSSSAFLVVVGGLSNVTDDGGSNPGGVSRDSASNSEGGVGVDSLGKESYPAESGPRTAGGELKSVSDALGKSGVTSSPSCAASS